MRDRTRRATPQAGKVFVDTNILAYAFDGADPAKQAAARAALGSGVDIVISTQVMLELFTVLTRKLTPAWEPAEAAQVLDHLAAFETVGADHLLVRKAAHTSAEHQLTIWDAMILEAAAEAGCATLWTEDLTTGATIRGVTITNPLTPTPATP